LKKKISVSIPDEPCKWHLDLPLCHYTVKIHNFWSGKQCHWT